MPQEELLQVEEAIQTSGFAWTVETVMSNIESSDRKPLMALLLTLLPNLHTLSAHVPDYDLSLGFAIDCSASMESHTGRTITLPLNSFRIYLS